MTKAPKKSITSSVPKRRTVKPTVKGFTCPTCAGEKPAMMVVVRTKKPIRGLIVRYRKCPLCPRRIKTEERLSKDGYEASHAPPK